MKIDTQRLLDLTAAAQDCCDEDLLQGLREANGLYQRGLHELLRGVMARLDGLPRADLMAAVMDAGVRCDTSQDRDELLLLLALARWEMTPAAMAYSELAKAAAYRGINLISGG
ncbi:hypothetical protein [Streptomyces sp. SCL15-6]|uniref:hypothetical protein n=1 Tax=Streptomyces sp. SCL15-6 TaxID=2967222 RepID=UPI0029666EE5|nr:hypothetical protein [Streptomyces sp. SCL15-6]